MLAGELPLVSSCVTAAVHPFAVRRAVQSEPGTPESPVRQRPPGDRSTPGCTADSCPCSKSPAVRAAAMRGHSAGLKPAGGPCAKQVLCMPTQDGRAFHLSRCCPLWHGYGRWSLMVGLSGRPVRRRPLVRGARAPGALLSRGYRRSPPLREQAPRCADPPPGLRTRAQEGPSPSWP